MPDYIYPDTDTSFSFSSMEEFWDKVAERNPRPMCQFRGCTSKAILIYEESSTYLGNQLMGHYTCLMQGWRHGDWWQAVKFK